MNDSQHHVDFKVPADPRNHFYPEDCPADETARGKIYPKKIEAKTYMENINDGAEV